MILFYSDQHLRDFGSFPPFNVEEKDGLTKELSNTIKGFFWVAKKIRELKPELVVNAGDVFHNNEYISTRTLHGAAIAFGAITQACREVNAHHVILAGNHDIYSQGDKFKMISSASILSGYGIVKTSPHEFVLKDGFKLGTIPYTPNLNEAYTNLASMADKVDLIVTHLDFEGAMYESGMESKSKLSPNFEIPIVSGHIHTAMQVGSVTYIGSLVQHKFYSRDLSGVGGILIYDQDQPEDNRMTRFKNNASQHYVRLDLEATLEKHKKIPFPPNSVALQVYSDLPLDEAKPYLEGYDYVFLAKKMSRVDTDVQPVKFDIDRPEKILRKVLEENYPETLKDFDATIKTWSES